MYKSKMKYCSTNLLKMKNFWNITVCTLFPCCVVWNVGLFWGMYCNGGRRQ